MPLRPTIVGRRVLFSKPNRRGGQPLTQVLRQRNDFLLVDPNCQFQADRVYGPCNFLLLCSTGSRFLYFTLVNIGSPFLSLPRSFQHPTLPYPSFMTAVPTVRSPPPPTHPEYLTSA